MVEEKKCLDIDFTCPHRTYEGGVTVYGAGYCPECDRIILTFPHLHPDFSGVTNSLGEMLNFLILDRLLTDMFDEKIELKFCEFYNAGEDFLDFR